MKKALLIGINYTTLHSKLQLKGCITDSYKLKDLITIHYGFNEENITMLNDDVEDDKYLPTRPNILRELYELKKCCVEDEVWIYYSGHGSYIRDINGDEESSYDSVMMPLDYMKRGYILDDQLFNILKDYKSRTVVIFDSCHSGTICDMPWVFQHNTNNNFNIHKFSDKTIENKNIVTISSSLDTQLSIELTYKNYNLSIGVFTSVLLLALRDNNYNAPISKIYNDVCEYMKEHNFKQLPLMTSSSRIPTYCFGILK